MKTFIIILFLCLMGQSVWGAENKCEKLGVKHAWKNVEVFGGYNIDGIHGFKNPEDYQRCANCGMYKLMVLTKKYKYWESDDEKDHSLSWFNIDNISFSDIKK